ncbi:hypothetical protein BpHYR1_039189 [Brachionus plicatilis]|uniref:Uncharacterized protein n=1 Tax=Brachionus plicatilis TaxID=10195 RepID=A0A3M7T5Q3_BRAPC|nr:hypothetical protein BpHYR1_039189 [Brachionus plicatilis]
MNLEMSDQIKEKNVKSTKSNKLRNVSDFIWSKLTNSRKNSSLSITKTNSESKLIHSATVKEPKCLIDSADAKSEKKNRRNIFHIFESSSKLKLNTGVNKKNLKNNKSPNKNLVQCENEIILSVQEPTETVSAQKVQRFEPDLDSFEINLMDNSILKSKIRAAKRNPRSRQSSAKPDSNLNTSNSYQTIDMKTSSSKISVETIDEKLDKEKLDNSQSFSFAKKSTNTINAECDTFDVSQSSIKLDLNPVKMAQKEGEKVKIAIYDNNITQCSTYDDNSSSFDIFESLSKQFKSKSCEKIEMSTCNKDSNNNHLKNANDQKNLNYLKNNRYSYFDAKKLDKIDLSKVMLKSLSHTRSLKLNQKSPEGDEYESGPGTGDSGAVLKPIGQLSNSYKIPNSKKREPIVAKCGGNKEEPVWKELAFRKHSAWSKKNPDYSLVGGEKPSENGVNYDLMSNEGKVKCMIRDLQKT